MTKPALCLDWIKLKGYISHAFVFRRYFFWSNYFPHTPVICLLNILTIHLSSYKVKIILTSLRHPIRSTFVWSYRQKTDTLDITLIRSKRIYLFFKRNQWNIFIFVESTITPHWSYQEKVYYYLENLDTGNTDDTDPYAFTETNLETCSGISTENFPVQCKNEEIESNFSKSVYIQYIDNSA